MKKTLILILAFAMLLALGACAASGGENEAVGIWVVTEVQNDWRARFIAMGYSEEDAQTSANIAESVYTKIFSHAYIVLNEDGTGEKGFSDGDSEPESISWDKGVITDATGSTFDFKIRGGKMEIAEAESGATLILEKAESIPEPLAADDIVSFDAAEGTGSEYKNDGA